MIIKEGFKIRQLGGEYIIVGEGLKQVDFTQMVVLNETAAYLWKSVEGKDFTAQTLSDLLLEKYDVDPDTACSDARKIASKWVEAGLVQD